MNIPIETLLNYLFGSTTLISIFIAWRSRNSEIKKAEATALEGVDSIYQKMVIATDKKFDELQTTIIDLKKIIDNQTGQINNLRSEVKKYSDKCKNCKINNL